MSTKHRPGSPPAPPQNAQPNGGQGTEADGCTSQATSDVEKTNAAALLGIVAGPELLILNDHSFTAAMYRAADDLDKPHPTEPEHQKVRMAAIDALAAGGTACATYIKTGMAAADKEDIKIVTARREQQAQVLKAKTLAAAMLGITVTDADKAKSVYEFIVILELRAHDHNDIAVKAAARRALAGSEQEQWDFLTTGIATEHNKDLQRLRDEDTTKTEQERAEAKAREARVTAAYYALGIVITVEDPLAKSPDQNFVREVVRRARKDSEVYLAAYEAWLSDDPADYTKYVNTGAMESSLRDEAKEKKRVDDENIRLITEIRTRANSRQIQRALIAAADKALAGSRLDRVRFLNVGQYENLTQTIRTGPTDYYLSDVVTDGHATLKMWKPGSQPDLVWKVEPGLSNPGCFSFQSTTRPNHYLRWVKDPNRPTDPRALVTVAPTDGTDSFKAESTWCSHTGLSIYGVTLNPYLQSPGSFMWVPRMWEPTDPPYTPGFTFESPQKITPIDRAYADRSKGYPSKLGNPTRDAIFDANGSGYREYEKGRLYLVFPTVSVIYNGPVLDKFLSLGAENNPLGYPRGDETGFGTQGGRFQPFTKGAVYYTPATGAIALYGPIYDKYAALGSTTGTLGNPTTAITDTTDHTGQYVDFSSGGSIYWQSAAGAHAIQGVIKAKWVELGSERGAFGFPTSDEIALPRGRRTVFQGGRIDSSTEGGPTMAYKTVAVTERTIQIKGIESGKCLQVSGTGTDAQQNWRELELWDCFAGAPKQLWDVVDLGGNKYALKNRNSGKCLRTGTNPPNNGDLLIQYECLDNNYVPQQWEFTTTPDGSLSLRSVETGKVADVIGHKTANGSEIQEWMDLGGANQRWTIVPS